MGLQLHVDVDLEALARHLADAMTSPRATPADPFTPELVVVPGDGVRTWLTQRLADHLGIVANLDVVYPATLITRVLGGEASGLGRWRPGPLTWAVVAAMADDPERFGDPEPLRARTIADLFDRYTLHRPVMARAWSAGRDVDGVGAALADHHRWQPALWRRIEEMDAAPSDAVTAGDIINRLRHDDPATVGGLADLPDRIAMFGISSVPALHLEVLAVLSRHRQVSLFVPAPSLGRWHRTLETVTTPLALPLDRRQSPLRVGRGHPLLDRWGRSAEEGLVLLSDLATTTAGAVYPAAPSLDTDAEDDDIDPASEKPPTVLSVVQESLRADRAPTTRTDLAPGDASLRWHRTFGPTRQVEALRDELLHLFALTDSEGRPRFEPRDVTVLCTDIGTYAPLVDAVFAGDPDHGVPAIPVVVADRTVSDDNPFALALDALFELGDGRFRLDDLCDFAMRPAVRQRFGLSAGDVTRVAELLAEANVRWGLGPQDQARLGMEPLGAHTVLDGLHRVMVAAVGGRDLSDRVLDGIVPAPIATVDDLVPLGRFSHLVDRLSTHIDALSRPADICTWIARVEEALTDLIEAEDPMALRRVRRVLAELDDDGRLQGRSRGVVVNPGALVALARRRLVTASGRARFGTGRVTVSAMTAQRGIPAPVVCLLGADATAEAVIGVVPDDLIAAAPCVGDRDARSEQRAQFLDAIVSATQRFIICSTGFDLRTRAELPPSIMVAELVDLVRSITGTPLSSIDHPRQGWSETVFDPDAFGLGHPWGFDRGARDAALARRSRSSSRSSWMEPPLERPVTAGLETITPTDLLAALRDPCGIFARRRLGLATDDTAEAVLAVDIELESPGPLRFWQLEADAFATVLGSKPADTAALDAWVERAQGAGDLPPRGFAHAVASPILARARRLDDLLETHGVPREALGALAIDLRTTFADGTPVAVTGTIAGVSGSQLVVVTPSTAKPDQDLAVWLQLALCQLADPGSDWSAVLIRRNSGEGLDISRRRLRDIDAAQRALDIGLDLFDQARCRPVPFFPGTSRNLAFRLAADRDPDIKVPSLRKHWDMNTSPGSADRYRPSVSWFFDLELEDLRRNTDADEWADRIFSAMDSGVDIEKLSGGTARSGRKARS